MKKIILIVIAAIVALSLLIGAIVNTIGFEVENSSIAIIGGDDGPTEVYSTDSSNEWEDEFLIKLSNNEFLPGEVIANLPEFSKEKTSDGSTLCYWRSYGESKEDVVHKIEVNEKNGKLIRYHYKSYSFDVPLLDTPMPMDTAGQTVNKFAEKFISEDDKIEFKNKPTNHTLYDPDHVEFWFANYKSEEYMIAVNLDMGSVIYFEVE